VQGEAAKVAFRSEADIFLSVIFVAPPLGDNSPGGTACCSHGWKPVVARTNELQSPEWGDMNWTRTHVVPSGLFTLGVRIPWVHTHGYSLSPLRGL